jgi:hypothetical protein
MAKERKKKHHSLGEHIWEELIEYIDPPERFDPNEKILERDMRIIRSLKREEYFETRRLPAKEENIASFMGYIDLLKEFDLDIGRGESEYGFKMPLAEKRKNYRPLIIFRRK